MTEPQPAQDATAAAAEPVQNPEAVDRAQTIPSEEYEVVALADDGQPQQEQSA